MSGEGFNRPVCLYIATGVAKLPLTDVIREIWRFIIALIAILLGTLALSVHNPSS